MRFASIFASVVLGSVALTGCSAPVDSVSDSESAVEAVDTTVEALSTSAAREAFVGTFVSGARTLTLEDRGTYVLDTGIRCIKAPCPSLEEGRWALSRKAGAYQITLSPKKGAKVVLSASLLGNGARLVSKSDASVAFEKVVEEVNPCIFTTCPTNSVCEAVDGQAQCITLDACARVRCPGDTTCVANGESASCVPVAPPVDAVATCALVLCAANTFCVEGAAGARCLPLECPKTEFVNCMPTIGAEQQPFCNGSLNTWARENCPGVEFAY